MHRNYIIDINQARALSRLRIKDRLFPQTNYSILPLDHAFLYHPKPVPPPGTKISSSTVTQSAYIDYLRSFYSMFTSVTGTLWGGSRIFLKRGPF